ncbi:MAG: ABC transporter permease [Acidobacteriota bacterium]
MMRGLDLFLKLYPASFRADYAAEMRFIFAERRQETEGMLALIWLWLETLGDVLVSSALAHWDLLRQDLAYLARTVRRTPGFAITAVVVTALGIGANTAVFSLTDQVLIRPLPFPESERLVKVWQKVPGYSRMETSALNYRDWVERSTSFQAIAAYHCTAMNLLGIGDPLRLEGTAVTPELFQLLGSPALRGRTFNADDERADAPPVIVLSHSLWQRVLGGDPDVVGQTLRLDDATYTVVGVMPPAFSFPRRDVAFWLPRRFTEQDFVDRNDNYLEVVARLAPGVSLQQAHAEMTSIATQLASDYPETNSETQARVIALRDELSRKSRLMLTALFGASACVLLIACTNLANLLLARALGRRKELTVRTAIGAGRERLVRQLLTESLTLAAIGGALGFLLATAGVPLLARLVPTSLPIAEATAVDVRVLIFSGLLTLVTGVAFGVLPALRMSRGIDVSGLMEGPRSGLGGRKRRLRSALVTVEVAAAVVLLIMAGLLIRALLRVQAIDPGFRTEGVLTLQTPLPVSQYEVTADRARLYDQILTQVRALPGVESAGYISFLPMVMRGGIWPVEVAGDTNDQASRTASLRFVTPGYFSALDIDLEAGRDVADTDTEATPMVAVVSRSFADRYWPGQDPLGRHFTFGFRERTVAGVVGDVRFRGLERQSEPQVYLPHQQVPDGAIIFYMPKSMVVRTSGDPMALVPAIRGIVREADPELPVTRIQPLADIVAAETASRQTQIRVLAAFAGLAMLLAGVGIYSLLAFGVSQRTSEIGLRMALGAQRQNVSWMVLREGGVMAAAGAVAGLIAAYLAGRAMQALLFGVRPDDVTTYAAAVTLVLLMTLAGCLVPALRAARVDPTSALKAE